MNIKLDEKVKEYLYKKGKDVLKIDYRIEGCWVKLPSPYVTMVYPKKENHYKKFMSEGVNIFIKKGIRPKKELLSISISGFSIFKYLEVSGIDIEF